jgi:hypothetical protein
MQTDIQSLVVAVTNSLSQYGEIYVHLEQMNRDIGSIPEAEMLDLITSLQVLQGQAKETDSLILAGLDKDVTTNRLLQPLLVKRDGLVRKIIALNTEVQQKAKDAKSLLAHELVMLRRGQAALSGYKPQQAAIGKIVNNSL